MSNVDERFPVEREGMGERTMSENDSVQIRSKVREAYRNIAVAQGGGCGCSASCCSAPAQAPSPSEQAARLGYAPAELDGVPEGANMGLGCGNPQAIAMLRPGETVLDLGCGGGFDCFIAARRVGPEGRVIGVDMTAEMIDKARRNAKKGGFTNVEFRLGEIEHLPVADSSVDVIISNCVINLSPDKEQVYREAYRVLKPGGRLAISDVVAINDLPKEMTQDTAKVCGCIGGAAAVGRLEEMLRHTGFHSIEIEIEEQSKEVIEEWFPGSGAEAYVRSASIRAVK
jgi:arsenite methyltransferase